MGADAREDTSSATSEQAVEAAVREWIARPSEVDAIRMYHALIAAQPLMGVQRPEDVARAARVVIANWINTGRITGPAKEFWASDITAFANEIADAILALPHTGQPQEGELRQFALDAAERIIKLVRSGETDDNCLSEGADEIVDAIRRALPAPPHIAEKRNDHE